MTAFLARRIAALLGLGRKARGEGALTFRVGRGRQKSVVVIHVTAAEFRKYAKLYGPDGMTDDTVARFIGNTKPPKVGGQGIIATSFENLCEEYLIHEFMHMAFNMKRNHTEEEAVKLASSMCAASIGALRDAGYHVPERR